MFYELMIFSLNNRLAELGLVDGQDYDSQTLFDKSTLEDMYPEYVEDHQATLKSNYSEPENECCSRQPAGRYWYHPDYLGSVAMVTNDEGIVHQMFFTNPWSEEMYTYNNSSTGSFNSPYRFNGKELDQETGLAYYGARYYDNQISMWLSVDPLAMYSKQVGMSPYHFSANNPVMNVDSDGRIWDPASQDEANDLLADIRDRRSDLQDDLDDVNRRLADGDFGWFGSREQYEEKQAFLKARIDELDKSEDDWNDVDKDQNWVYAFSGSSDTETAYREGKIFIAGSSQAGQVHELRHAGQVARGAIFVDKNTGELRPATIIKTTFEVDAYKAQYAYAPGSLPPSDRTVEGFDGITPRWVAGVYREEEVVTRVGNGMSDSHVVKYYRYCYLRDFLGLTLGYRERCE